MAIKKYSTKYRTREERKITYYSNYDRRLKVMTICRIKYSDGRLYDKVQFHNGFNKISALSQLRPAAVHKMLGCGYE